MSSSFRLGYFLILLQQAIVVFAQQATLIDLLSEANDLRSTSRLDSALMAYQHLSLKAEAEGEVYFEVMAYLGQGSEL